MRLEGAQREAAEEGETGEQPAPGALMSLPIAATIANEFAEADSPMYLSSLIALGFLLFVVTFIVLSIARLMLRGLAKREGTR